MDQITKELLQKSRALHVMCTLIDRSGQSFDMAVEIEKHLNSYE